MTGRSKRPTLMSPADRRRLIEAPLPAIRTLHSRSKSWGGTDVSGPVHTEGRLVFLNVAEDENFYHAHKED